MLYAWLYSTPCLSLHSHVYSYAYTSLHPSCVYSTTPTLPLHSGVNSLPLYMHGAIAAYVGLPVHMSIVPLHNWHAVHHGPHELLALPHGLEDDNPSMLVINTQYPCVGAHLPAGPCPPRLTHKDLTCITPRCVWLNANPPQGRAVLYQPPPLW